METQYSSARVVSTLLKKKKKDSVLPLTSVHPVEPKWMGHRIVRWML
jgi:hypothetical protein